ncbi:MAG: hypothetical protein AAF432_16800 [Planctomycetota bacterium]
MRQSLSGFVSASVISFGVFALAPIMQPAAAPGDSELVELLEQRVHTLNQENNVLRNTLAQTELNLQTATQELEQLRQFIVDHHEYGNDFEQYKYFQDLKAAEQRKLEQEEIKRRRDQKRAERDAKRQQALAERNRDKAAQERNKYYSDLGFGPIGLDVYTSRMAYAYETNEDERRTSRFDPAFGWYDDYVTTTNIDFSKMTLSGSVLNAAEQVRNIGVAITFFDESGNQVGHEIVQVKNARPNVPYPFTAELDMALNRAFDSVSTYVLYADEIVPEAPTR